MQGNTTATSPLFQDQFQQGQQYINQNNNQTIQGNATATFPRYVDPLQEEQQYINPYNNESMQGNTTARLSLYEQDNRLKQQMELQNQEMLLQSRMRTQQQASFNQAQLLAAPLPPIMQQLTQQTTLSYCPTTVQNKKTIRNIKGAGRPRRKVDSYKRQRRTKSEMNNL